MSPCSGEHWYPFICPFCWVQVNNTRNNFKIQFLNRKIREPGYPVSSQPIQWAYYGIPGTKGSGFGKRKGTVLCDNLGFQRALGRKFYQFSLCVPQPLTIHCFQRTFCPPPLPVRAIMVMSLYKLLPKSTTYEYICDVIHYNLQRCDLISNIEHDTTRVVFKVKIVF